MRRRTSVSSSSLIFATSRPSKRICPASGVEEADEHLEHDALADAGGAHDGERLAAEHLQIELD